MGEDHEHRDDAQQLDTGVPPFAFWRSGVRRRGVSDVCAAAVRALDALVHGSPLRLCSLA